MNDNLNKSFALFDIKVQKAADGKMTFTAYGNVKNVKDHAWDIAVDGVYENSINEHIKNGTMPKLLWSHNQSLPPVGKILSMVEDDHGLKFEGQLSNTPRGLEIYELIKDGSLDSFSIGYRVILEKWDNDLQANILIEIKIREISFVNFACCEESLLEEVKSHLKDGKLPTKRELQNLLRESTGFSKSQAEKIANEYNPKGEDIFDLMAKSSDDNDKDIFDQLAEIS